MKVIHDQILTAPPLDWIKVRGLYLHSTGVWSQFFAFAHAPLEGGESFFVLFSISKKSYYEFELDNEIRSIVRPDRQKFNTLEEAMQKADEQNLDDLADLLERYGVSVVDVPPPEKEG